MRTDVFVIATALAALSTIPAQAQWGGSRKGEGALVLRDGAPAYRGKGSSDVKRTFSKGEAVAGLHKEFLAMTYELFEEDGRVRVLYPKPGSALMEDAWMDPADLLPFAYDCCDEDCTPVKGSFKRAEWNACFREGLERSRARFAARERGGAGRRRAGETRKPASSGPKEKPLTNDDVLAMVKADLGDELVIGKIRQAPREELDVSPETLVKLKQEGLSRPVLDAMIRRAGER
jgi:hypothetical protein